MCIPGSIGARKEIYESTSPFKYWKRKWKEGLQYVWLATGSRGILLFPHLIWILDFFSVSHTHCHSLQLKKKYGNLSFNHKAQNYVQPRIQSVEFLWIFNLKMWAFATLLNGVNYLRSYSCAFSSCIQIRLSREHSKIHIIFFKKTYMIFSHIQIWGYSLLPNLLCIQDYRSWSHIQIVPIWDLLGWPETIHRL